MRIAGSLFQILGVTRTKVHTIKDLFLRFGLRLCLDSARNVLHIELYISKWNRAAGAVVKTLCLLLRGINFSPVYFQTLFEYARVKSEGDNHPVEL